MEAERVLTVLREWERNLPMGNSVAKKASAEMSTGGNNRRQILESYPSQKWLQSIGERRMLPQFHQPLD
jgi:hypothetical protein